MPKKLDPASVVAPQNESTASGADPTPPTVENTRVSEQSDQETGAAPTPPGAATVENIATTLINEAPEPQPNAISQANDERAAKAAAEQDSKGTPFDATIHRGDKTSSGEWRKKSGRKPTISGQPANGNASQSGASRPKLNIPGNAGTGSEPTDTKVVNARAGGTTAANLLIMLSVGIGGAEWLPRKQPQIPYDEKEALEGAFADYFQAKGWEDLPAGWALVAGLGMYALPRFAMPVTQKRATGFRNWIAGKYINWKAKRAKKKFERQFGPDPTSDIERGDAASRERYRQEQHMTAVG